MKDYNNPKDNVLCPHCAKSPCVDATEQDCMRCEETYFREFVVIDGLNQHPSGKNFSNWLKDRNN